MKKLFTIATLFTFIISLTSFTPNEVGGKTANTGSLEVGGKTANTGSLEVGGKTANTGSLEVGGKTANTGS